MKAVFLGDTHIGVRNDSLVFAEHHIRFFEEQLFPFLVKEKIKTVYQFGDLFDRRKFVNIQVLEMWKDRVFDVLESMQIDFHVLVGNHDVYFRDTNEVNSPSVVACEYANIHVYDFVIEHKIDDVGVLIVPWINRSNYDYVMKKVQETKSTICFGHFEFSGYEMDRGRKCDHGMNAKLFNKFDTIYTGHFHHRSNDGHVYYLGTPYQMTWIDYADPKGFYVFDTEKLDVEFIENKDEIFLKIEYDEDEKIVIPDVENKFVKVIVVNKTDDTKYDVFMTELNKKDPADVKTIEDKVDVNDSVEDEDLNLEDTFTILDSYVDVIETDHDRAKIKSIMKSLYVEAMSQEQ